MSNICSIVRSFVFLMECQLSEYFFSMNTNACSVEDMNMLHITECFSLSSVTFIEDRFCLFRTWSFTLSTNDLDPNDKSNSVSSSPMMNCCALAPPWGQTPGFLVLSWVSSSSKITCLKLVCSCPRANNGFHRSIIHQFIGFPLLKRPTFVIVPSWVPCWVRAFNKSQVVAWRVTCATANNGYHRSIIFLSLYTQRTLTFINYLPRAFWCRRWQSWGSPCNRPIIGLDFAVTLSSPEPFCVIFDITSEQSVELKWLMSNKHNKWLHSSRVKFPLVSMSSSWFLVSMYLIWILVSKLIRSNNQSSATLWILETCLVVGLLPFTIIMITASLSSNTYNKASWCENWTFEWTRSTLLKTLNIPWDCWPCAWLASRQTTGFTVLSWFWVESCFQGLKQSDPTKLQSKQPI